MKGPVPTMLDMLIEIAFNRPKRRSKGTCSGPFGGVLAMGLALKDETYLNVAVRILQFAHSGQQILLSNRLDGASRRIADRVRDRLAFAVLFARATGGITALTFVRSTHILTGRSCLALPRRELVAIRLEVAQWRCRRECG